MALDEQLQELVDELRIRTASSRCTLRRDVVGPYDFPILCESLAENVPSLRGDQSVSTTSAPNIQKLRRDRRTVVQNDCRLAADNDPQYDDDDYRTMLETYGGLAACIVVPIFFDDKLEGTLALHQLGEPRVWSKDEIALAEDAGEEIASLLRDGAPPFAA